MVCISMRHALPVGVTKLHVFTLFRRGRSIGSLAYQFRCEPFVIEDVIRAVLRRQSRVSPHSRH